MTENEIREEIKELHRKAKIFENSGYATAGISFTFKKSARIIHDLLTEIQQYRAIGTVEEFKELKEKEERFDRNIKMFNEIGLEIRNRAIDEFAEKLKAELNKRLDEPAYQHSGEDYYVGICSAESIVYEIAEEMKAGGE